MAICAACGKLGAQRAHVKDKSEFGYNDPNHDFHNIIYLCANHHYNYFDKGLMAILIDEQKFLILMDISRRLIQKLDFTHKISIMPEYVEWKNSGCHGFLQAEMRIRRLNLKL